MHDKKFLSYLNPSKGSMPVFDKAYNFYYLFSDRTKEGVNFVCRLKDNAKSQLQEVLFEKELKKEESDIMRKKDVAVAIEFMVLAAQLIEIKSKMLG